MKRFAAVLIVILIAIPCAWAREGIVTWTWYENDPMVEYYRYQVDAEEPGMWTVVDWSVTEVSITLDVSVVHTLFSSPTTGSCGAKAAAPIPRSSRKRNRSRWKRSP